uniref:BTB domain-containing protein n=1 Tax=Chrysotila carterae TaxID=13221 RepID=A0A7S4BU65_CHRCT
MRDVPAPRQVCCAGGHSLALTASGDVLSWGSAKRGLLGQTSAPETALEADPDDESEVFRTSPRRVDALEGRTIVSIACAESHNLALDADGRVWAWGSAEHGRLGIAETDALPSDPYDTTTLHKIQPVPTVVCGLQGKRVTQLACADFHSLCLTEQGDVWAWGSARYGLLAMEDVSGLRTFPDDEHEVFQPTPIFLEGLRGTRIVQVSCAKQHNVVVDQSGGVWAWGSARYGRVGIENIGELPTDPDDEQEVFTPEPTLLHALRGEVIVQVACAAYHSLALSADGEVWAWGSARYGLLGLDDVDALPADPDDEQEVFQPTPTRVDGLCGKRVVQVVCSEQNSMAVCADGDVWSWGAADCGLLGTDDVDSLASEEALRTSILVGPIYFSAAPLQLPGVHDAVQVALANKHALVLCALDRDEATGAAGVCAALGKLLDDGTGADVHFTVGDSSRTFRAHRLILCARSEYFSRMFGETATASGLAEAALQQVRVEECTEFAFEAMLRWIYTGRVDLHDETLADVVDVADRRAAHTPDRRVRVRVPALSFQISTARTSSGLRQIHARSADAAKLDAFLGVRVSLQG